jgi:hypothetical protein
MALNHVDLCHLMAARVGRSGGDVATLGRLGVFLHPADRRALHRRLVSDRRALAWLQAYQWGDYADRFFCDVLRFDSVQSIDFSDYEGATITHDIGTPIPANLHERFDLVVDGGTLEHVFNFPVAIGNMMRMVRLNGTLYAHMSCNNLCGHGLYQFSPELMHRLFAPASGFKLHFVRVEQARHLSIELSTGQAVYDVADPAKVGSRINLISSSPVVMLTMAERVRLTDPLDRPILQSDYVRDWQGQPQSGFTARLKAFVRSRAPVFGVAMLVELYMRHRARLGYRHHYQRVRMR